MPATTSAEALSPIHRTDIVGSLDEPVITLNRLAAGALGCAHEIAIVPGATHLFEEAGTLDEVVELAGDWFRTHFRGVVP